jgi:hypothetical protein
MESHAVLVELITTLANIRSQLPALQDPASFEGLSSLDPAGLQQIVYNKKLTAFDNILEKALERTYDSIFIEARPLVSCLMQLKHAS